MTSIGALLRGVAPAGVYQVPQLDLDPVLDEAMERGWTCGVVDGSRITDHREALVEVGRVLDFPDHYGVNLDALADCLSDLGHRTLLIWLGAVAGLEALIPVLEERCLEEPAFSVLISIGPDPG
ncbi:MAG TPA: barstar family protein [Marmoricola sp.]|nr:barstar family protein [Marmoricola sp.]HNI70217.1 barstar family protein [Marmoricola sp.]HNJ78182.1 barstar family protein [Marmoricola sp.]HNN49356.1 barstar family protein [Marmoricola sp.]HNO38894.1 barstar family protein [Marmoricola sp.]